MDRHFKKRKNSNLISATCRLSPEWIEEAKCYEGGKSEFIREAVYYYKGNHHLFKFREILEMLAGEILLLYKWKEKGHPSGIGWTNKHDQMLQYYERCFEVLENSPYNEKQR